MSIFHPQVARGFQSDVGQNSVFQGDSHKLLELSEPILSKKIYFRSIIRSLFQVVFYFVCNILVMAVTMLTPQAAILLLFR